MATQHITVRLPADLVVQLREQAKRNGRSLAFVMAAKMGYWSQAESVLRQEPAKPFQFSGVTTASQLPAPSDHVPAERPRCTQAGHTGFQRGDGYWCVTCRRLYR